MIHTDNLLWCQKDDAVMIVAFKWSHDTRYNDDEGLKYCLYYVNTRETERKKERKKD